MRTDFSDDDIVFDHNDNARELLRATTYLRRQLDLMYESGAPNTAAEDEDEAEGEMYHLDAAISHLVQLESLLDERAGPSVDDVDWTEVQEDLSDIDDVMGDIYTALSSHQNTLDSQDWMHVNPYAAAEEVKIFATDARSAIDSHLQDAGGSGT